MAVKRIRCAPSVDYAKRFGHCLNLTVCFQTDIRPGFFCGNSAVRQYLSLDCHGICLQKLSVQTTCFLEIFVTEVSLFLQVIKCQYPPLCGCFLWVFEYKNP